MVLFVSTVTEREYLTSWCSSVATDDNRHPAFQQVTKLRRRSKLSQNNMKIFDKAFGDSSVKLLGIPEIIDQYNCYKSGVNQFDQFRSYFTTRLNTVPGGHSSTFSSTSQPTTPGNCPRTPPRESSNDRAIRSSYTSLSSSCLSAAAPSAKVQTRG